MFKPKLDDLLWNEHHPRLVPDIFQVCLQAVSSAVQTEILKHCIYFILLNIINFLVNQSNKTHSALFYNCLETLKVLFISINVFIYGRCKENVRLIILS